MLAWRLCISAILIPSLIGLFVLDHKAGPSAPVLLGLCVLLAARSAWEFVALLQTRSFEPKFSIVAMGSVAVIVAAWSARLVAGAGTDLSSSASGSEMSFISLGMAMTAFVLVVLILFVHAVSRYREPGRSLETLSAEVLIVTYTGVLLAVTSQLRWVAGADAGYLTLGSLVISAKFGDIGAYTLGRLFGKKKMAPLISPGKTWAGAVGALLGAGVAAVAWLQFATPAFNSQWTPCPWYWAAGFGVVIGLVGLIGDLCESLIKRDVDQKDSAQLLPGFGGLLDLLDSVLFAGPVAYVLWLVLPLATWG